jgi:hypothetical protein
MTVMRAISLAGLLLLAGCTAAVQQQAPQDILRRRGEIRHTSGTSKPVAVAVGRGNGPIVAARAPCETNDPMPVGQSRQPPPPMLRATTPYPVAPMPNYCPVTVPAAARTTHVSTPRPPRRVQPPAPTEPRP